MREKKEDEKKTHKIRKEIFFSFKEKKDEKSDAKKEEAKVDSKK